MSQGYSTFTDSRSHNTKFKYATVFDTVVNLLNSILGAGIFAIANSMIFCGFFPSLVLISFCALLSYISTIMIIEIHYTSRIDDLAELSRHSLGSVAKVIMVFAVMFFCYSCMTSYLIMATVIVQKWLNLIWRADRKIICLIYSLSIPIPLTIPRATGFLSSVSTICVICLLLYSVIMIIKSYSVWKDGFHDSVETYDFNFDVFSAFGVYSLTFAVSTVVLPIVKNMEHNIHKRYKAFGIAFFISYFVVLIPGACGYLLFGRNSVSLILDSFQKEDVLVIIAKASCLIVLTAGYPVIGIAVMSSLSTIIFKTTHHEDILWKHRIVCLLLLNIGPLIVALFMPDVRPILSIGGALGGGISIYIIPPLIYIKMIIRKWCSFKSILCILFSTFGVLVSVISTYQSIVDAIESFKE